MTNTHPHNYPKLLTAILAAGALLLTGTLTSTADAQRAHIATHHHAPRHNHTCTRHRQRTHHASCAKAARNKRRAAQHHHHTLTAKASSPATPAQTTTAPTPAPEVPSGPCPNTELIPTPSNLPEVQAATLCLINKIRIQNGEQPLSNNSKLDTAAQNHSEDMVTNNYFNHTTPTGEAFNTRITATGYAPPGSAYELGENIDCATLTLATPNETVNGWMNSPEHRENILNSDFHDSGIGITPAAPPQYANGQPGATYTQDFGVVSP